MNGTIAVMGEGNFIPKSECSQLATLCANGCWSWPGEAKFAEGYDVRNATVIVELPQIFPVL